MAGFTYKFKVKQVMKMNLIQAVFKLKQAGHFCKNQYFQ